MTQTTPPATQPRENQILAEPATVDRCQQDYDRGAADRATAFKQMRRAERLMPRDHNASP
ncbi:hypothetical protein [Streptomyces sp. WM6378]|uniref:hypothetical protein n=1 Tax=Streptomyces sp. WM6378 TaxID=1415557 RepID=UPI0006AF6363|nr:hypothetical protein [Streptomyces sp. WM6378]KOU50106.1 hypothetical protein ADK54_10135 [Streptomyces sp. WM6378]